MSTGRWRGREGRGSTVRPDSALTSQRVDPGGESTPAELAGDSKAAGFEHLPVQRLHVDRPDGSRGSLSRAYDVPGHLIQHVSVEREEIEDVGLRRDIEPGRGGVRRARGAAAAGAASALTTWKSNAFRVRSIQAPMFASASRQSSGENSTPTTLLKPNSEPTSSTRPLAHPKSTSVLVENPPPRSSRTAWNAFRMTRNWLGLVNGEACALFSLRISSDSTGMLPAVLVR